MSQQGPQLSEKDAKDLAAMKGGPKGWRYSMAFGVMYGNIPVGIIFAAVVGLLWLITRH